MSFWYLRKKKKYMHKRREKRHSKKMIFKWTFRNFTAYVCFSWHLRNIFFNGVLGMCFSLQAYSSYWKYIKKCVFSSLQFGGKCNYNSLNLLFFNVILVQSHSRVSSMRGGPTINSFTLSTVKGLRRLTQLNGQWLRSRQWPKLYLEPLGWLG